MTGIRSKHDEFFKNIMRHPEMAQDFFATHLPDNVVSLMKLSTIKLETGSFIDETLNKYESDMLFSVKKIDTDENAFIYCLVEHQSTPDAMMPFRLLCYMFQFLKSHVIQNKENILPLPFVYPMVLYNGNAVWTYDRDFFSLFGELSELTRRTFFEPSSFIDVCRMDESTLLTKHLSNLMLASLRRAKDRKELERKVKLLSELFLKCHIDRASDLARAVLKYNTMIGVDIIDNEPINAYWTVFIEGFSPEYREIIMNLEQATLKEGIRQGVLQGIQQGVQQDRIEIATRMICEGVELAFISTITEVSMSELKKIAQKIVTQ